MNLRADEEVSLTARGVRLHGPDAIGVNGQTTASLPAGTVHLGNFRLLQKWLSPNFTAPNKQRWNRSLGKGRLMNPAGTAY